MKAAPKPDNENLRIQVLNSFKLLDTPSEDKYDKVAQLTADIFSVPIVLLSLVDENRQWFKAKVGVDVCETSREDSFCSHVVYNPNEVLIIPNAKEDPRFHDNPLVTGEPHITFYSGAPLLAAPGLCLGTLCIIDNKPREFTPKQADQLKTLANCIVAHFEVSMIHEKVSMS